VGCNALELGTSPEESIASIAKDEEEVQQETGGIQSLCR
jgi:hypothetical protein